LGRKSVAVRKGLKIVCPSCKSIVGEALRDVEWGEILTEENITIYDAQLKEGDKIVCPKCGFPLCVETPLGALLHTEEGWMPLRLPTESILPDICEFLKKRGIWRKEWNSVCTHSSFFS